MRAGKAIRKAGDGYHQLWSDAERDGQLIDSLTAQSGGSIISGLTGDERYSRKVVYDRSRGPRCAGDDRLPLTSQLLWKQGLLAPLDEEFTVKELDAYLPQFIEEGRLADGKLYVFPIAKSTEVLFVNQTLFDRFSAATGVELESLATFEGIAAAAVKYYQWTDGLTPDQANDGKTFFTADSWFNVAQVGMAQLGGEFVHPDHLKVTSDLYKRVWDFSVLPALAGGYAVTDGYSLFPDREIVCPLGSTAESFTAIVSPPDNTMNKLHILSCLTRPFRVGLN